MTEIKDRPPRIYYDDNKKPYIILKRNGEKKKIYLKVKEGISLKKLAKLIIKKFRKRKRKSKTINKRKKRRTKKKTKKGDLQKNYPLLQSTGSSFTKDNKVENKITELKNNFDYVKFLNTIFSNQNDNITKLEQKFNNIVSNFEGKNQVEIKERKIPEVKYYDIEEKEEKDFKGLRQIMKGVYVSPAGYKNVEDVMDALQERKRLKREIKEAEREYLEEAKRTDELKEDNYRLQTLRTLLETKVNELKKQNDKILEESLVIINDLNEVKYQLNETENNLIESQENLINTKSENKYLNEEIDELKKKKESLEIDSKILDEQLLFLNDVMKNTEQENEELNMIKVDLEKKNDDLQTKIALEKSSKYFLEVEIDKKKRQLEEKEREFKIINTSLQDLSEEINLLDQQIIFTNEQKNLMEEKNKELSELNLLSENKRKELEQIKRELESQTNILKAEKNTLEGEKKSLEEKNKNTLVELTKTEDFLNKEKEKLAKKNADIVLRRSYNEDIYVTKKLVDELPLDFLKDLAIKSGVILSDEEMEGIRELENIEKKEKKGESNRIVRETLDRLSFNAKSGILSVLPNRFLHAITTYNEKERNNLVDKLKKKGMNEELIDSALKAFDISSTSRKLPDLNDKSDKKKIKNRKKFMEFILNDARETEEEDKKNIEDEKKSEEELKLFIDERLKKAYGKEGGQGPQLEEFINETKKKIDLERPELNEEDKKELLNTIVEGVNFEIKKKIREEPESKEFQNIIKSYTSIFEAPPDPPEDIELTKEQKEQADIEASISFARNDAIEELKRNKKDIQLVKNNLLKKTYAEIYGVSSNEGKTNVPIEGKTYKEYVDLDLKDENQIIDEYMRLAKLKEEKRLIKKEEKKEEKRLIKKEEKKEEVKEEVKKPLFKVRTKGTDIFSAVIEKKTLTPEEIQRQIDRNKEIKAEKDASEKTLKNEIKERASKVNVDLEKLDKIRVERKKQSMQPEKGSLGEVLSNVLNERRKGLEKEEEKEYIDEEKEEKEEKEGKEGENKTIDVETGVDESEFDEEQVGQGKRIPGGLYTDQIDKIMKRYKPFVGVYASNEINELPTNKKKFGFIMNLEPNTKSGSHWVGVYIDAGKDKSIEYYDSFGKEPSKKFMKDIKRIVDELNPDTYLKFKVNKIKQQSARSENCGIFAIKFLMDRFQGYKFKDCTGYSEIEKGEKMANKLRNKFEEFGYI